MVIRLKILKNIGAVPDNVEICYLVQPLILLPCLFETNPLYTVPCVIEAQFLDRLR